MTDLADRRDTETEVYQPAEDSHLLAEAASADLRDANLGDADLRDADLRDADLRDADLQDAPSNDRSDPPLALEVGTGSGYVAETVGDETGLRVLGSDLNPHACRQASERGVEAVRADLLEPFRDGVFDAVLFNAPYLPTEPDDERDDWMEVALSGGEDGRAVIEPFLDSVGRVLGPDGAVYLLVSSLTGVEEVVELAAAEGFSAVALQDESFPFETLTVLKLLR